MKQYKWLTTWRATNEYVDINTGEIIPEKKAKQDYTILKTKKHAKRAKYGTGGLIIYTRICEPKRQGQLFS